MKISNFTPAIKLCKYTYTPSISFFLRRLYNVPKEDLTTRMHQQAGRMRKSRPHEFSQDALLSQQFGDTAWELQASPQLIDWLQSTKSSSHREKAMKAMTCLASGQWIEDVCRQQKVTEDDLDLFTAKLDDSTRLVWERAVAFSARCYNKERKQHVYTEVIRLWSVVTDDEELAKCVTLVSSCHRRGKKSFVKKRLMEPKGKAERSLNLDRENLPRHFFCRGWSNRSQRAACD